jgi:hypothetical protein
MHAMMEKALPPTPMQPIDFLAAFVKGGPGKLAIKTGDVSTGTLTTIYDGPRPQGYEVRPRFC